MKLLLNLITLAGTLMTAQLAHAGGSDFVAREQITFQSNTPDAVMQHTASDIRNIFEIYEPALDSGTTIISPKRISGSASEPIMQLSIQKCVFVICKSADLFADISIRPTAEHGCTKSYNMVADIRRSSEMLSDVYSSLNVDICYTRNGAGAGTGGTIVLTASVVRAPNYSAGIVQTQIFSFLKEQVRPIRVAVSANLQ